ncbi:hypothetical protein RSAG8_08597, partial [Rhizoctonia solani AG-8 WAC10335]
MDVSWETGAPLLLGPTRHFACLSLVLIPRLKFTKPGFFLYPLVLLAMSSFVDSIILSAPEGSNPYTYAADFVATIIPRKPDWYFANIIASGIVAAINLISTIACFFVMWKRSQAGTGIITSTYSAIGWSDLVHMQFGLIDILTALATQWAQSATHNVQGALYQQAADLGTLFLVQKEYSQHAFQRNAWTCGAWYLLCIVLFTPTAIWFLWVIRDTINQRSRRVTPHAPAPTAAPASLPHPTAFGDAQPRSSFAPFSRGHTNAPYKPPNTPGTAGANWTVNSQAGQTQQDDSTRPLRRALLTASLQFAATFFCLGVAAGSWLWIAADAGRLIVNSTLHALAILLTIWVYVIVGCLVNLFILIRTRRPDDSPATGNNMPLSAIKASHTSSSQSQTRPEPERKPVYIIAHTTTHVVVDDTHRRSSGSDRVVDVTSAGRPPYDAQGDLESNYSLNSAHFVEGDPTKVKNLDGPEWRG